MRGRITKIRIPLETLNEEERKEISQMKDKFLVVVDKEPCLTCGHKTRLQFLQKTDGKTLLVKECLYCLCRIHTAANRQAP